MELEFDFVVVGADLAGCVLANRLGVTAVLHPTSNCMMGSARESAVFDPIQAQETRSLQAIQPP